jgi:hypothetical protein
MTVASRPQDGPCGGAACDFRPTRSGFSARSNLAAVSASTGSVTEWTSVLAYNLSPPAVTVNGLAFASNLVFVAGLFDTVRSDGHNNAAAIDPETGLASGWYPGNGLNGSATVMSVGAGRLYVGGQFSSTFNNQHSYFEVYAFESAAPFRLTLERWEDGLFHCRLLGTDGQSYVLEATYDFSTWDWVDTVTTSGGYYDFVDPTSSVLDRRFYRARLGP